MVDGLDTQLVPSADLGGESTSLERQHIYVAHSSGPKGEYKILAIKILVQFLTA